jgi:hypothetical protein
MAQFMAQQPAPTGMRPLDEDAIPADENRGSARQAHKSRLETDQ